MEAVGIGAIPKKEEYGCNHQGSEGVVELKGDLDNKVVRRAIDRLVPRGRRARQ